MLNSARQYQVMVEAITCMMLVYKDAEEVLFPSGPDSSNHVPILK